MQRKMKFYFFCKNYIFQNDFLVIIIKKYYYNKEIIFYWNVAFSILLKKIEIDYNVFLFIITFRNEYKNK